MRSQLLSVFSLAAVAECALQCAKNITGTCVDLQLITTGDYDENVKAIAPLCLDNNGELTVNVTIPLNDCLTILYGGQLIPGEGAFSNWSFFNNLQTAHTF
ncbi:hypothetical protein NLG97_g1501 [Lecanicillium saksenae]|uniref:Uncharacterized protein n=1 Tax=Lecanicillium saksenae TaxID=468837 RepID=A0ACC1R5H4_9HYPO|nr:hypothetical protein NLG97_g1501 [Lecanicillium saksenae]